MMKKSSLSLLFVQLLACLLYSCDKHTSDLDTLLNVPVLYNEIIDSNLQWRYDPVKELLSAKLACFTDESGPYSSHWIKAVYQFSNGTFEEIF